MITTQRKRESTNKDELPFQEVNTSLALKPVTGHSTHRINCEPFLGSIGSMVLTTLLSPSSLPSFFFFYVTILDVVILFIFKVYVV